MKMLKTELHMAMAKHLEEDVKEDLLKEDKPMQSLGFDSSKEATLDPGANEISEKDGGSLGRDSNKVAT